jgi:2-dehydro-3-deoxyphosphogluconate aldolase/(4S)-4-hydroxy-2-oxoglutarate aldolase
VTLHVEAVVDAVESERVLAIVRADGADEAVRIGRALVAGGIRVLEFSLSAAGALDAIEQMRAIDDGPIVGAGTVLSVSQAEAAASAGAQYLVAPGLDPVLLDWAERAELLHIPGAFSPTEVLTAQQLGARLIKLFPAGRLGPRYVADLRGPMPDVRLVPTGGIDNGNAAEFLRAGAVAVALGSSLAQPGRTDLETTQRARRITEMIAGLRRDT